MKQLIAQSKLTFNWQQKMETTSRGRCLLIATVAFGMGVDCPDVRQIVHIGLPDDIGSYIQETGRASQDGQVSMVTLLQARIYHKADKDIKLYVASKCRRNALVTWIIILLKSYQLNVYVVIQDSEGLVPMPPLLFDVRLDGLMVLVTCLIKHFFAHLWEPVFPLRV